MWNKYCKYLTICFEPFFFFFFKVYRWLFLKLMYYTQNKELTNRWMKINTYKEQIKYVSCSVCTGLTFTIILRKKKYEFYDFPFLHIHLKIEKIRKDVQKSKRNKYIYLVWSKIISVKYFVYVQYTRKAFQIVKLIIPV